MSSDAFQRLRASSPSFQLAISRAEFKSYGRPPMPGETGRHEPCGRQLRLESNILNCLRTAMRTATAKCTESNARKRLGCATCVSEQFEVGMKWPRKKHSSQLLSGCATHEAGSSQQCVDARHGVFLPTLHTSLGIRLGFWPRLCLRSGLCTFLMNPKVQVVPTRSAGTVNPPTIRAHTWNSPVTNQWLSPTCSYLLVVPTSSTPVWWCPAGLLAPL